MSKFLECVYLSAYVCIRGIIPGLCNMCVGALIRAYGIGFCALLLTELEGESLLGYWVGANPGHVCVFIS